jgi:hypothetical protein
MSTSRSNKLRTLLKNGESRREESALPPSAEPAEASDPSPAAPAETLNSSLQKLLQEPRTIEETRIPQPVLADLALKNLYFGGMMRGGRIAQAMHLHFSGVVEPILRGLKADHLVEVTGGSTLNPASYQYSITNKGGERARELLERNRYVGPCPVALRQYIGVIELQAEDRTLVNEAGVRKAL